MTIEEHTAPLPNGSRLESYEIQEVLGQGSFGVTYRGLNKLGQTVAIKEYFPSQSCIRNPADQRVLPTSTRTSENYAYGLERFKQEAHTLAQFHHPNIVRVFDLMEANQTAYLVMDYEDGEDLERVLEQHEGPPSEADLQHILMPLLDGLAELHRHQILHRDIKPANIFLRRRDESPVLIDFGAARQMRLNSQGRSTSMVVSDGYSPFEQYAADSRKGPFTDLYALAGVLYRAIAGQAPPDAQSRVQALLEGSDPMIPAAVVGQGKYSATFLQAIDHALAVKSQDRPQTVAEWRQELLTGVVKKEPVRHKSVLDTHKIAAPAPSSRHGRTLAVLAVAAGLTGVVVMGWQNFRAPQPPPAPPLAQPIEQPIEQPVEQPIEQPTEKPVAQNTGVFADMWQRSAKKPITIPNAPDETPSTPPTAREQVFGGMAFVWVPGGTFEMGCGHWTSDCDEEEEKPVHVVILSGFWLGKTEVTNRQYRQCVDDGGCRPPEWQRSRDRHYKKSGTEDFYENLDEALAGDDYPVVGISWDNAQELVTWLNDKEDGEYRLPTEAEWEYACRSGGKPEEFSGGGQVERVAWFNQNSENTLHPVATKAANGLGLHDMSGNVWEWVQDWRRDYTPAASTNPVANDRGSYRVNRGGSWGVDAWRTRCTVRDYYSPVHRDGFLGARLVRIP